MSDNDSQETILEIEDKVEILLKFADEFHVDREKALDNAIKSANNDSDLIDLIKEAVKEIEEREEKTGTKITLEDGSPGTIYNPLSPDEISDHLDKKFTSYLDNESKAAAIEYKSKVDKGEMTMDEAEAYLKQKTENVKNIFSKFDAGDQKKADSQESNKNKERGADEPHIQTEEEKENQKGSTIDQTEFGKTYKNVSFAYSPDQHFDEVFNSLDPKAMDYRSEQKADPSKDRDFIESLKENNSKTTDAMRDVSTYILKEVHENRKNTDFAKAINKAMLDHGDNPDFVKQMKGVEEDLGKLGMKKKKKTTDYDTDWASTSVIFTIKGSSRVVGEDSIYDPKDIEKYLTEKMLNAYSAPYPPEERENFKKENKASVRKEIEEISETEKAPIYTQGISKSIDDLNKDLIDAMDTSLENLSLQKTEVPIQMDEFTSKDVNIANAIREEIKIKEKDLSGLMGAVKVHGLNTDKGIESLESFKKTRESAAYFKAFASTYDKIEEKANGTHLNPDKAAIFKDLKDNIDNKGTDKAIAELMISAEKYKKDSPDLYNELKEVQYELKDNESKAYKASANGVFEKYAKKGIEEDKSRQYTGAEVNQLIRETIKDLSLRGNTGKTAEEVLQEAWKKNPYKDTKITQGLDKIYQSYQKEGIHATKQMKPNIEKEILTDVLKSTYESTLNESILGMYKDKNETIDSVVAKEVKNIMETGKLPTATIEGKKTIEDKRSDLDTMQLFNEKVRLKNVQKSLSYYESKGMKVDPDKRAAYDAKVEVDVEFQKNKNPVMEALKRQFPKFELEEGKGNVGKSSDRVNPLGPDNDKGKDVNKNSPQLVK